MEKPWEKENWKKAKGIKYRRGETNSVYAIRDYSFKCYCPSENLIALIKGYHIWWCSIHHQPMGYCSLEREKICIKGKLQEIIDN